MWIELETPGADIVGFEHPARSDADKAAIADATARLGDPVGLFGIPSQASCALETVTVSPVGYGLGMDDDHDDRCRRRCARPPHKRGCARRARRRRFARRHDEAHEDEKDSHAEFHAEYSFAVRRSGSDHELDFHLLRRLPWRGGGAGELSSLRTGKAATRSQAIRRSCSLGEELVPPRLTRMTTISFGSPMSPSRGGRTTTFCLEIEEFRSPAAREPARHGTLRLRKIELPEPRLRRRIA